MTAVATLALVLLATMIAPIDEGPDVGRAYDGHIVGLIDPQKKEIIPKQYCRIDYVGRGLYMAWQTNPKDKLSYGLGRTIFTKDGKQVQFKVPPGYNLASVCWFGAKSDQNPNADLLSLPADAILKYKKDYKVGLCTIDGKVIVPAEYYRITKAYEGKCFLSKDGSSSDAYKLALFDCASHNLKQWPFTNPNPDTLTYSEGLTPIGGEEGGRPGLGYVDEDGKFAISPVYQTASPFTRGMARVSQAGEVVFKVINKTGKVLSPPHMDVGQFYGDYAVARFIYDKPRHYGVVNRNFEFVLPPKYSQLTPVFDRWETDIYEANILEHLCEPRGYLVGNDRNGGDSFITLAGKELVRAPKGYMLQQPVGTYVTAYNPRVAMPAWQKLYVKLPEYDRFSKDDLRRDPGSYVRSGPDRFIQSSPIDDGKFSHEYWISSHKQPVSRYEMFARFLKENDLIGMGRADLEKKLLLDYQLNTKDDTYPLFIDGSCTWHSSVNINLRDNKVESFDLIDWTRSGATTHVSQNSLIEFSGKPGSYMQVAYNVVPKFGN